MRKVLVLLTFSTFLSACSMMLPRPTKKPNQFPQWTSSWRAIGETESGDVHFIDLNGRRLYPNKNIKVSTMLDKHEKGWDGVRSTLSVWLVDCEARRYGLIDWAQFSDQKGTGVVIAHRQKVTMHPERWSDANSGSISEAIVAMSCLGV